MDDPTIDAMLRDALQRQRDAWLAAPCPTLARRLEDLDALERLVRDNQDAICAAIDADYGGRSRHETLLLEVYPVLDALRHTRRHLRAWLRPQRRGVDRLAFGLASNRVMPQPLGVVGVIVPWNFPLNLSFVPLVAILAAGNRAMVKLSENSRHLARLLIDRAPRYLPPDRLRFFDETGGVGVAFSRLPFDHLLFTGSGPTGRAVMAAAAANLCPVTLELGGKSPAVVCRDFPLEVAAERVLRVKCLNAGQICTTVDHVYVPAERIDAFVALAQRIVPRLYPNLDTPDYTAIIDARAFERLCAALDEARAGGARVLPLLPGPAVDAARRRIAPHLVLDAPPDCALMRREIFGPILPVLGYDRIDDVVQRIQAGDRPLALYPFSRDRTLLDDLLRRVMSGGVTINDALLHVGQADLPFGGVGASGMGHYHGREGFTTFSKLRPVFRQARPATTGLIAPPYGRVVNALLRVLLR